MVHFPLVLVLVVFFHTTPPQKITQIISAQRHKLRGTTFLCIFLSVCNGQHVLKPSIFLTCCLLSERVSAVSSPEPWNVDWYPLETAWPHKETSSWKLCQIACLNDLSQLLRARTGWDFQSWSAKMTRLGSHLVGCLTEASKINFLKGHTN